MGLLRSPDKQWLVELFSSKIKFSLLYFHNMQKVVLQDQKGKHLGYVIGKN